MNFIIKKTLSNVFLPGRMEVSTKQQKDFVFSNIPKSIWQKPVNILSSHNTVEFFWETQFQ